jgi:hypothetical protein
MLPSLKPKEAAYTSSTENNHKASHMWSLLLLRTTACVDKGSEAGANCCFICSFSTVHLVALQDRLYCAAAAGSAGSLAAVVEITR